MSLTCWQESTVCLTVSLQPIMDHTALCVGCCIEYCIQVVVPLLRAWIRFTMLNYQLASSRTRVLLFELLLCFLLEETMTCLVHHIPCCTVHHVEMRCILHILLNYVHMGCLV